MTITQTKPQFLTEALVEQLNNQWKVDAIESDVEVLFILNWRLRLVVNISKFGLILSLNVLV